MNNATKKIFVTVTIVLVSAVAAYLHWRGNGAVSSADVSLAQVEKKGKLIVGADIPYGSMEFFDQSGKPAGVDVDIAQEIANALGVRLEFRDYDWDLLFPAVKKGEIDLAISSITITEERQKELLFSAPYFNGGQSIVTRIANHGIKSLESVRGKTVGVQGGTTGYEFIKEQGSAKSIVPFVDNGKMTEALLAGKVDLLITDYVNAKKMIDEDPSLNIVGDLLTHEYYGIATRMSNRTLIMRVDEVLRDMKRDGRLEKILNKWLY